MRRLLAQLGLAGIAGHQPPDHLSSRIALSFTTPALVTGRKIGPAVMLAAVVHRSMRAFTPTGTVTVRVPLPSRSGLTQRTSRS